MIVIASRHEKLCEQLADSLRELSPTLQVRDKQALDIVLERIHPEVVFLDTRILGSAPAESLRSLADAHPQLRFIVFGCKNGSEAEVTFVRAGARGFLRPQTPFALVPKAVRSLRHGELWVSRQALTLFLNPQTVHRRRLSKRQLQVVRGALTGLSNKQIAESLGITERTVKAHFSSVYAKLGIHQRSKLSQVRGVISVISDREA